MATVGRPRLLVLRALGLGDLLTAVPALRALAAAFPDYHRVLACPRALEPLVELAGAVDEVVDARPLAPLASALHGVQVAVNLHGRGPESHRLLQAVEPERVIAFANAEAGVAGPSWRAREHEVRRWCRMLAESGVPADPTRLDVAPPAVAVPEWLHGATILHPGAASGARRWPVERFVAVARSEIAAGRTVAITGASRERGLAEQLAALADLPADAVLAGRTALPELAATFAAAGRILCGDTGVAHLATAVGTPSVVHCGPTPPSDWGPPADRSHHRALWAGRTGDPHGSEPDAGLLEIGVEDAIAALAGLPRPAARAA